MLLVPRETMQKLINYLAQRPYIEVYQLIAEYQAQVKPAQEPKAEEVVVANN